VVFLEILLEAGLKIGVADQAAEHVEGAGAFLVDHVVQDAAAVGDVVMNDGDLGAGAQDGVAAALEAGDEGVVALVFFGIEEGEIGGEAFAEPDVVPVTLGDAIAEPLVGDFVGDQG